MAFIHLHKGWEISESQVTPEDFFLNRRQIIKGLGSIGVLGGVFGLSSPNLLFAKSSPPLGQPKGLSPLAPYPFPKNSKYTYNRKLTPEVIAASYNNFYEFTTNKAKVWKLTDKFKVRPWEIEISGLVPKPKKIDVSELVKKMPLEERIYRFRCVEAWSMVVPWSGFPLKALLDWIKPLAKAKYIRFVSFHRPKEAPGQLNQPWYPWPYYEGLSIKEAANELSFMVVGIYGHDLPKQHGAPIRLVTPWKYGFKSIKSIAKIEFLAKKPPTFWNDVTPKEYFFDANVEPHVPHPRWSQATERDIASGKRIKTKLYNGYQEFVSHLYKT